MDTVLDAAHEVVQGILAARLGGADQVIYVFARHMYRGLFRPGSLGLDGPGTGCVTIYLALVPSHGAPI